MSDDMKTNTELQDVSSTVDQLSAELNSDPVPTLTLDPVADQGAPALNLETEQPMVGLDAQSLTPQEQKVVDDFASKIELSNSNMIMQYGSSAQKKIAGFSETALSNIKSKDLGEIGDMLSGMVVELKSFDVTDQDKGFFGFFKKGANKITAMQARYADVETNVNKIVGVLEGHQRELLKDVALLDKMYDLNKTYFKELSMYIIAGKKKIEQAKAVDLPAAVQKSQASGLPEDAQQANDLAAMIDRFEKKIHDLELTRVVALQMAPQIRLVQNNDILMAEKIQSSLVNTIPLWKSQMVLAMGVEHSAQAAKAQADVTNMTNDLLKKNADKLKMATIATAKESERGVVDLETLQHTNQSLIETFDEVLNIQAEGREKRQHAEQELVKIENELKQKLLDIRS